MRTAGMLSVVLVLWAGTADAQKSMYMKKCPVDSVASGALCMDAYEASVWRVPNPLVENKILVKAIQQGTATQADLIAGGATQQGQSADDNYAPCRDNGQNCADDLYAVSLPWVTPSVQITWFQAQAACQNARKRLPTSAEWQEAVAGTPDPGPDNGTTDCRTTGTTPVAAGSRSACVSSAGAFDMVGNVYEWVADWVPRSTTCGTWPASVTSTPDHQCLAGTATSGEPGALIRGGSFTSGTGAGPLAIYGLAGPSTSSNMIGFRCAR